MRIRNVTHILAFILAASLGVFACGEDDPKPDTNTCEAPKTECGGTCVDDLKTNDKHCGKCDNACAANETCEEGLCKTGIPDLCADVTCEDDETCVAGECVPDSATECTSETEEADCAEGETCVDGMCVIPPVACTEETVADDCAEGEICVDGFCGPVVEDLCDGVKCDDGQVCVEDICVIECEETEDRCRNSEGVFECYDLQTSSDHCGECGTVCDTGEACAEGVCVEVQ